MFPLAMGLSYFILMSKPHLVVERQRLRRHRLTRTTTGSPAPLWSSDLSYQPLVNASNREHPPTDDMAAMNTTSDRGRIDQNQGRSSDREPSVVTERRAHHPTNTLDEDRVSMDMSGMAHQSTTSVPDYRFSTDDEDSDSDHHLIIDASSHPNHDDGSNIDEGHGMSGEMKVKPEHLRLIERVKLVRPLIVPYMLPLFFVFWAEYTINQGIAPVLLFPLSTTPFREMREVCRYRCC